MNGVQPRPRAVVVGAGIIGLAIAWELSKRGHQVSVVEKEPAVAWHQSSRNSGVIHSGLYYRPGSLKARLGVAGAASMRQFASQYAVAHQVGGKLVVATYARQLPALAELARRAAANGVPCRRVSSAEAREYEPGTAPVGALRVETTGIIDYSAVCRVLEERIFAEGGQVLTATGVRQLVPQGSRTRVVTSGADFVADLLINAAGLHSDRIARMAGLEPAVAIVPFRGEFHQLRPDWTEAVQGLIYPVPNPELPFLGVHLTRGIDGRVHVGPNAVLAGKREGYRWRDVDLHDIGEAMRWPGVGRLARRWARVGAGEVARSASQRLLLRSVQELVPGLPLHALEPAPAGVRAQAVDRAGRLVDDFVVARAPGQVHILNAPSPAATASLEIARYVVAHL